MKLRKIVSGTGADLSVLEYLEQRGVIAGGQEKT